MLSIQGKPVQRTVPKPNKPTKTPLFNRLKASGGRLVHFLSFFQLEPHWISYNYIYICPVEYYKLYF